MNRVVLIGRLTKDAELRYSAAGTAVCKFTMAVNRKFTKDGQQQADFIPCTVFGKAGETIAQYVTKGRELAIEGRLQITHNGEGVDKKWFTEVVVEGFDFIGSKGKEQRDSIESFGEEIDFDDSEIPFK